MSTQPAGADERGQAAAALDANFAELLAWYASSPGGEIRRDRDLLLTSSGVPFRAINAAALADLSPTSVAERIDNAIGWLGARTDRWRWLVGPSSRPLNLGDHLLAAGLHLLGENVGMVLDLRGWRSGTPIPAGVTIEPVVDEVGLERWRDVQRRGLGLDEGSLEAWWIAHRRPGFGPQPLVNWVASLDGAPVSAAALFIGANVAGIYNVCTVPEARGRWIGAAVTAVALDEGASRGLGLAVLGASEIGHPVYRRLGFRDVSRLRSYVPAPGRPTASTSVNEPA